MQYPFSVTDTNITVFIGGKPYTVPSTHMGFNCLKNHLKNEQHDYDYILGLVDQKTMITKESGGRVNIVGDSVFYNGQPAHGAVVDKLLAMRDEGFPIKPWVLFMEKLMANPNEESRQSLYNFLEHFSTPITPDGDFLAFKRVRDNFMDIYSGTFDHTPGKVVEMDRALVDSDSSRTCSSGLHACASNYLGHFYSTSPGYKVVVVKINPTDVCAVPNDYEFSKMRVCRYEVLSEAEESDIETISSSQFSTFGQPEPEPTLGIGSRVMMTEVGHQKWGDYHISNPRGVEGTIYETYESYSDLYDEGFKWRVKWDNGHTNCYREEDLMLVESEKVEPLYPDALVKPFLSSIKSGEYYYLHKDGTWHHHCGEQNMWSSREEAQAHLEKWNRKDSQPMDEYTELLSAYEDDYLYDSYYDSYDSYC